MCSDQAVALSMVQGWEAPRIAKRDQRTLPREEIYAQGLGGSPQLPYTREIIDLPPQLWFQQGRPDEVGGAVAAHLEVGEEAVDDVGLGGEDVDGVHLGVRFAAVFYALDGSDVVIEDVIFLDGVVYELLGGAVDD